jgi:guanine deaminase
MNNRFMALSIELALEGIHQKGHGPFGAVIVKNDNVVGIGTNQVTKNLDPTAHAEITAIRDACRKLNTFALNGCEIYTSCEPCPMCLGAIFWSRLDRVYFGATRDDAAKANFDDHHFYEEIQKPLHQRKTPMLQLMRSDCIKLFNAWEALGSKIPY